MKKTQQIRLSAEDSKLLTRVMTLGAGTNLPVVITPGELAKLIGVIARDLSAVAWLEQAHPDIAGKITPSQDYYALPDAWFLEPLALAPEQHVALLQTALAHIEDFATYLRCLSELHKRRRKYAMILSAQPMPRMVQVSPRALIEYGRLAPAALASWLTWRKFFYDLDNRAAQETGYLFEPILAAAIGGEPQGAKTLVVKRSNDATKGRQIDCWKVLPDGRRQAYEFKLRVTIAASGQGRFAEELQFAEDCRNSGAVPMLVVLDPTMNPRLAELQDAYQAQGGKAYLGEAAWARLEQEAGETMARFIEKYVRQPVAEIARFETPNNARANQPTLLPLEARYLGDQLMLKLGEHERWIARTEDSRLSDEEGDA